LRSIISSTVRCLALGHRCVEMCSGVSGSSHRQRRTTAVATSARWRKQPPRRMISHSNSSRRCISPTRPTSWQAAVRNQCLGGVAQIRVGSADDVQILKRIQGVRAKRSMALPRCVEPSDSKPAQHDAGIWLTNGYPDSGPAKLLHAVLPLSARLGRRPRAWGNERGNRETRHGALPRSRRSGSLPHGLSR